jgi:DnaJ-class molecular chaperone
MICERCQGTGYSQVPIYAGSVFEPCPDCQGQGIAYCCDEAGANPPNVHKQDNGDGGF